MPLRSTLSFNLLHKLGSFIPTALEFISYRPLLIQGHDLWVRELRQSAGAGTHVGKLTGSLPKSGGVDVSRIDNKL